MFGDGSYSGNVVQGGSVLTPVSGVLTVTSAATVAPDGTTGASVVMCDTLVIDGATASLKPSTNSKGLIVFAKTGITLLNGAKLNIDKLGKAGNFGNLTAYSLAPVTVQRKLKQAAVEAYTVLGEGAAGAARNYAGTNQNINGVAGSAAGAMQTGGGGAGAVNTNIGLTGSAGAGGKGGPCCGGAGSGGVSAVSSQQDGVNAGAYGGPGGDCIDQGYGSGGGAGDPVGYHSYGTAPEGAGGGLLMLFAPSVSIASGCIVSADGSKGGVGNYQPAGSAGGGCVVVVTNAGGYANSGTVRASGGAAPVAGKTGGAGGAGSVNIFTA